MPGANFGNWQAKKTLPHFVELSLEVQIARPADGSHEMNRQLWVVTQNGKVLKSAFIIGAFPL